MSTRECSVKKRIDDVLADIDEIEKYLDDVDSRRSDIDLRLSDVLHFIETLDDNEIKLTPKQCYHLVMFIRDLRVIRRGYAKESHIKDIFYKGKNKIVNKGQRKQLISELDYRVDVLSTPYKPRLIQSETIMELITVHSKGRKPKRHLFKNEREKENEVI